MYIKLVQTRLKSVFNEENKKRNLVPSKVWQTLDEIDEEVFDIDIEHLLNHHISCAADQMNLPEEECKKYFRVKEIEQKDDEDHYSRWKKYLE
jgi:hypothetical protein